MSSYVYWVRTSIGRWIKYRIEEKFISPLLILITLSINSFQNWRLLSNGLRSLSSWWWKDFDQTVFWGNVFLFVKIKIFKTLSYMYNNAIFKIVVGFNTIMLPLRVLNNNKNMIQKMIDGMIFVRSRYCCKHLYLLIIIFLKYLEKWSH